ncbi:hypothetical protein CRUP_036216 [Coryphaenoides rupestris]|nr:hypothetical protein CRUP_036216 [Coryphaenoides rupestris]
MKKYEEIKKDSSYFVPRVCVKIIVNGICGRKFPSGRTFLIDAAPELPDPEEELGLMSCDDISRYNVGGSQPGSKSSEAVSYYLDQDSGQYFSLLESDGPPGPEYDRTGRNTGVPRVLRALRNP